MSGSFKLEISKGVAEPVERIMNEILSNGSEDIIVLNDGVLLMTRMAMANSRFRVSLEGKIDAIESKNGAVEDALDGLAFPADYSRLPSGFALAQSATGVLMNPVAFRGLLTLDYFEDLSN